MEKMIKWEFMEIKVTDPLCKCGSNGTIKDNLVRDVNLSLPNEGSSLTRK